MKSVALIACFLGLASAGLVYPTAGPDAASGYASPTNDGYGAKTETRCTPVYDTVQEDRCESYNERVCNTQQRESCTDVSDQNCRAIVTTKQIRKCFNVTEILCGLKESVDFETVEVGFTVQRCQKVAERVCDTVYETNRNAQEDVQCLNVENPVCQNEERTIQEKTCRTTTQFECTQQQAQQQGYGGNTDSGYGSTGNSGNSGNTGSDYGMNSGSNSAASGSGYGSAAPSGYGAAQVSEPQVQCTRRQETKCFNTPRTVNVQRCQRQAEKVCERVVLQSPNVEERQNCRNEEKKVCQLEQRSQPKQVKKYTYNKQCRPVPRSVCENADVKQMVPSCVPSTRKECTYSPVEQCENIPKQHCFKVNKQVRRERCEQVTVGGNSNSGSGFNSGVNSGVNSGLNSGLNSGFDNMGSVSSLSSGFGNNQGVVSSGFNSGAKSAGFNAGSGAGFASGNTGGDY